MRGEGISIIVPQMSFKPEICQSGGSMGKTTKKSGQMKEIHVKGRLRPEV